jgi:hypothetical protein
MFGKSPLILNAHLGIDKLILTPIIFARMQFNGLNNLCWNEVEVKFYLMDNTYKFVFP